MVNINEKYKSVALKYYIENVEIPNLTETIEYYESLAMDNPKYIEDIEYYKKELDEFKYVLETL